MDIDTATLWYATRSLESHKRAIELGVEADLFVGPAKQAWKFINEYRKQHGELPGISLVVESTGASIAPPEEGQEMAIGYLLERMHERSIHRAIKYGMTKTAEAVEADKQDEAVSEIIKLSDHLRKKRTAQIRIRTLGQVAVEVLAQYEKTKRGEIGVPFPWPTMTAMTLGLWSATLSFFVARPGVGKCVEASTRIVNPITGVESTIKEVVEGRQLGVYSWDERSERGISVMPIADKVDTGTKECFEVTLNSGRSIVVTPEHPFLTHKGWKRADELTVKSIVGIPTHLPEPLRPQSMGTDVVKMLALLLSEGSYSGHHVGFSTSDEEMLRVARSFAEPRGATVEHREDYDYDISVGNVGGRTPNPARELLRSLGIDGKKAIHKIIPDEVYSLPDTELADFLSVFFMADGYVTAGAPGVTLASEKMVRQIQHLLLRFGVQSSVHYKPVKGGFHSWRLRVYSVSWKAFADSIPMWGNKKERVLAAVKRTCRRNPNAGKPKRVGAKAGVFWDRIAKIKSVGERRIFDLTVHPTENFIANDIIVHNTWSAVIMALHAASMGYKVLIVSPELGRVELGERLVAKHGKFAYGDMITGQLGSMVETQLRKTVSELEAGPSNLYILDDEDHLGPEHIEQAIQTIEPHIVFCDSIYMMKVADGNVKGKGPGSGSSKGGRYDRILETVDWLRTSSRRYNIPIVGISQLSRDAKMKKESADQIKAGKGTGGLEDAIAMSDTLFMDAHNLFALFQDKDMRLDKQLIYVPLKVRRQAQVSHVVIRWDMVNMDFDEIGTFVPSGASSGAGTQAGGKFLDTDYDSAF